MGSFEERGQKQINDGSADRDPRFHRRLTTPGFYLASRRLEATMIPDMRSP